MRGGDEERRGIEERTRTAKSLVLKKVPTDVSTYGASAGVLFARLLRVFKARWLEGLMTYAASSSSSVSSGTSFEIAAET